MKRFLIRAMNKDRGRLLCELDDLRVELDIAERLCDFDLSDELAAKIQKLETELGALDSALSIMR